MTASRNTPTAFVLVSSTGPSSQPDSASQAKPVISPLPFSAKCPAKQGWRASWPRPRGRTAVTPVRTSSPSIKVTWPTSTPGTSVMASSAPGRPKSNGTPNARARVTGVAGEPAATPSAAQAIRQQAGASDFMNETLQGGPAGPAHVQRP